MWVEFLGLGNFYRRWRFWMFPAEFGGSNEIERDVGVSRERLVAW